VLMSGVVFFCLASLATAATAQSQAYGEWHNGVTERWWFDPGEFTRAEVDVAVERWTLIEADSPTSNAHQWAGSYSIGTDTHGSYMRWSPEIGFIIASVDKCAARLIGIAYGRVIVSPTSVQFVYEYSKSASSHDHAHIPSLAPQAIKFIPVRWRGVHYLVDEEEMAGFSDYVAGLGEYNVEYILADGPSGFFLRFTDEEKGPVEELWHVPIGYERFVKRPVNAMVTSVGASVVKHIRNDDGSSQYERHIPVTVNVGSVKGVKPGMFFHPFKPAVYESVKITRVGRESSKGIIVRMLDDNQREGEGSRPVRVGWRLSTSPHKYFFHAP
jgi:hypothetical protein